MPLIQIDGIIDARGLACPIPVDTAADAIRMMTSGETLEVISTDARSFVAFAAWSGRTGNPLLDSSSDALTYRFVVRKA